MEKKMKNMIVIFILVLSGLVGPVSAADILDIGAGARSIGMSKTYTTLNGDGYSIFGNPAGLKGVNAPELVSMYGQMAGEVNYTMLGFVMPTQAGKFFAGYAGNKTGELTTTTVDANGRIAPLTNFDFGNDLYMLGYGNDLTDKLSLGLRLKYYRKGSADIAGISGSGTNMDLGAQYSVNDHLKLGAVCKNVISGDQGAMKLGNGTVEDMPGSIDLGIGYTAEKLSVSGDMSLQNGPAEGRIGLEWTVFKDLVLRAGMEEKSAGNNGDYINGSAGVGFRVGDIRVDYAYYYDSLVSDNSRHFVSISFILPGFSQEKIKTLPPVAAEAAPLAPVPVVRQAPISWTKVNDEAKQSVPVVKAKVVKHVKKIVKAARKPKNIKRYRVIS